ncbi:MAG: ATPase [Gammaproteobacteria bacterium]|nr:ATPase [Gammaproteobacteria bacterium]NBT44928.1 ATPase [Gammaproteobacteria bacterium]NBY23546.1 ATPase [Gammaproteobacteria bacterium]NDG86811.1 ATPase [Gammaproteobacteria bacterium]
MKMSPSAFRAWACKRITLLGMSGVGKTTLANKLPKQNWFHYSGDYRIGTRYLDEPISDNMKLQAMEVPFLKALLQSDSIYIRSNITIDNLAPISSFLGKIGDPLKGGLSLQEFKRRQDLHRQAEISAMRDVPEFIRKVDAIYGYQNFINDAGGSVCELDDPETLSILADNTLILYIKTSAELDHVLIERAKSHPKPLYYRETFLDEQLSIFMGVHGYGQVTDIPPDQFVTWVFPKLFHARLPRYESIAKTFGYSVDAEDLAKVQNEFDFIELICEALERG